MIELKDRIRGLREDKDMTQKELGEKLGVSNNTISAWEKGINEPNIATLVAMSRIFNVSIDYLVNNPNVTSDDDLKFILDNITKNPKLKKLVVKMIKDINQML